MLQGHRYRINADYVSTAGSINRGRSYAWVFNSLHPGGANFVMGDGSSRFVSETIDLLTWARLNYIHDGKPLEGVAVVFFSSPDHAGTGVTAADGSYQLGNGAEPGENKVYFTAVDIAEDADEDDEGDTEPDEGVEEDQGAKSGDGGGVPAKYRSAETSELTFTVPEGGTTTADFDLTSP